MIKIISFFCRCIDSIRHRVYAKMWMPYIKGMLKSCGNNVVISRGSIIAGGENISIGNYVYIGPNATIYTTRAKLCIGNYVMTGPNITIITGDHPTNVKGEYMINIPYRFPDNDTDVIIEDDVWIGANAMILKGVTIGKGSVIAAGVVVTKDIPPYSIYISKDKIKPRFNDEDIIDHERKLIEKYGENNMRG